jgi:dienelactone hydrolase
VKRRAALVLAAALIAVPSAAAYKNPTPGRALVVQIPGMHLAKVRRNVVYSKRLKLDVYRPRKAKARVPAVLLGGPPGFGKDSSQKIGWAQLISASGMAAVAFDIRSDNYQQTPEAPSHDVAAAIAYVRGHAAALGIASNRLCTLGFSIGTAPWHLRATMHDPQPWLRCNVVFYGQLGFDDPALQEFSALSLLRRHGARIPPMLVVKAGRDENEGINESIDRFAATARELHADVRVVTNATARHGFDLGPRTSRARAIVRETLHFLRARLAKPLSVRESCLSIAERASALRFFDSADVQLAGVLLGRGPRGIVLAHGRGGDLCQWLPYARELASSGYRVLAYDTRTDTRVDRELAAAVEALRRSGADRVAAAGSSLGALAAITGSAALPVPPDAVLSLSSPSGFGRLNAVEAARRLQVPILFAAAEEDQPFADDARELYAAAGSAERRLEILAGSAHGVDMLADTALRSLFDSFLADHL